MFLLLSCVVVVAVFVVTVASLIIVLLGLWEKDADVLVIQQIPMFNMLLLLNTVDL